MCEVLSGVDRDDEGIAVNLSTNKTTNPQTTPREQFLDDPDPEPKFEPPPIKAVASGNSAYLLVDPKGQWLT